MNHDDKEEEKEEKEELEKELSRKKVRRKKGRLTWRSLPNFRTICQKMTQSNIASHTHYLKTKIA
jgi:hypothetical protein